jgi:hypothetical protein
MHETSEGGPFKLDFGLSGGQLMFKGNGSYQGSGFSPAIFVSI